MNIIDFHTHVFPDDLAQKALLRITESSPGTASHTNGTVRGLIQSMDRAGVGISVLLPIATKPAQVRPINAACETQRTGRIIALGTLHPSMTPEEVEQEIGCLVASGVKGVKFHAEYQDFYIDDPRYFFMYELLSANQMIAVFHAGIDPGPYSSDHATPRRIRAVHRAFPSLKLVASHLGGWKMWNEAEAQLAGIPVFFDTAAVPEFMSSQEFVRLVRRFGTERVLFGTDSPLFDQADQIRRVMQCLLTEREKEQLMYQNARELLGIG